MALPWDRLSAAIAKGGAKAAHATELYLATACTAGVAGAPEALLARHGAAIEGALSRMGLDPTAREEAYARTLLILLVGEGSGPALAGYRGQGSLSGWLAVTAVRAAQRVLRQQRSPGHRTESIDLAPLDRVCGPATAAVWSEQEQALLDTEGAAAFREAVREALGHIDGGDRTVLRLHYAEGMSIDVLAQMWGVHRATAARRVARVRARIREHVLGSLQARFGSSPSSVGRWIRQMQSRLDGLSSVLRQS